jgi:hypothetical protein
MSRPVTLTTLAGAAAALCLALAACTAPNADDAAAGLIPDGVYRNAVSVEELLSNGASLQDARMNGGIQTLTVADGTYRINVKDSPPDCTGEVGGADGRTRFSSDDTSECAAPGEVIVFDVEWRIDGDALILSEFELITPDDPDLEDGFAFFWTSRPWTILE